MLSVYLYKCTIHSNKNSSQTWLDSQVLLISSRNGAFVPHWINCMWELLGEPKNSKPAGKILLRETKLSETLLHLLFKGGKETTGFHRKKKRHWALRFNQPSYVPISNRFEGPVVYRKEVIAKCAGISGLKSQKWGTQRLWAKGSSILWDLPLLLCLWAILQLGGWGSSKNWGAEEKQGTHHKMALGSY